MQEALYAARVPSPARRRTALLLLFVVGLGAGGVVWWRDGGKRLFFPRKWDAVQEGVLYRSGQIHRRLIEDTLRTHGIDLVIDLSRDDESDPDAAAERAAIERLGIRRIGLDLDGSGRGDPAQYVTALDAIARAQRAGEQVLVHCNAGSERTGGVSMLYRTLFQGWSADAAFAEYVSYRARTPRWSRVAYFLDANMESIARGLVASGALPALPEHLPVLTPADAQGAVSAAAGH
jgi:hypothetical protein